MTLLKILCGMGIILITPSILAQTPVGTNGNITNASQLRKVECTQVHNKKSLTIANTNRTLDFIISNPDTPEGEIRTIEVFNALNFRCTKTGAAKLFMQVLVGTQVQYTGQIAAGNNTVNIELNNTKGKTVKVKITNLSPTIENKRANLEFELSGITSSLFIRGYTILEKNSYRTYLAGTSEKLCTNGAQVKLTAITTAGTGNAAFARLVIKMDNANGTVLATETLLLNTTSKDIYIPSFCYRHKLYIVLEYLNNQNKPNFKYKIEGFAVVPLGESPPTAPQTPM